MKPEQNISPLESTTSKLGRLELFVGKLIIGGLQLGISADDLEDDSHVTTLITFVAGIGLLVSAYKDYRDLKTPSKQF